MDTKIETNMENTNSNSKRFSREQEMKQRIERCDIMIAKGYTADINSGEVYSIRNKIQTPISYPIKSGYYQLSVNIDDKPFRLYAHHFIFYYAYGTMPNEIDHIDNNKANNSISNLRSCTHRENMRNRPCKPDKNGKYRAMCKLGDINYYIGTFDSEIEKQQAIIRAQIEFRQTGKVEQSLVRKNKKRN